MADSQISELPWHPKITPYRLIVLATTIGLGTAKAVLTQKGGVFIPTTFEWLSGTVVFLLLFIMSPYDSDMEAPQYFSWLFEPDCMDLVWHLLGIFSLPRPKYISDQRMTTFDVSLPPVTIYRLLVSSSVVAFGLAKATFAYLGASSAATWTDWALGVLATSVFYCLGLYENSASNVWPSFFVDDHRSQVHSVSTGTSYTVGVALCVIWILYWANILSHAWRDPELISSNPESITEYVNNTAFKSFLFGMAVLIIGIGVVCLFLTLRSACISVIAWLETFPALRGRIIGPYLPRFYDEDPFFPWSMIPRQYLEYAWTILRILIHVAIHLFALVCCITISVPLNGLVLIGYNTFMGLDSIPQMVFIGFLGLYVCVITGILWFLNCAIVISLLKPLFIAIVNRDSSRFCSSLIFP